MSKLLGVLACVALATCATTRTPFDQMTAAEHRAAAAREHQLANDAFARITGEGIAPPETLPTNVWGTPESPGAVYFYDPSLHEYDDPETYVAWPRVTDPSERDEDAASEHRELALRHEAAAAALEGRPSPRPLPPPST
jgi:hypothetical protein